jgi:predicted Zn-dependent peptidase
MRKPTFMLGCFLLLFTTSNLFAQAPLSYQTVPNDPMQSRIYTLSNGMKVYLTVNKQEPRIQTYVAVHVGGKNDPAETTGLSHYLEHLLFKGTTHFGTSNYAAEKPLLDQIRQLYEVYRHTTDSLQRRAIYHQIDSISYEASRYSIPNEYDKLMTSIGSKNSNAYTSEDCTVYEEDIPSNQIENWAKVQSERFTDAVIRGFHTELEAVYEEFNIGLTQDERKLFEAINKDLYPNHPYGKQTVIGTQAHLKNPSIVNIDNHFHTYYVANNMAICMSGDLNPDSTIKVLEKYFSALRQNPNLPKMAIAPEKPIEQPIVTKIYGQQAAMVALAWRFPGERSLTNDTLQIASMVLSNGQAGLVDDDITLKQKMVEADAFIDNMADHSSYIMCGLPKEGQTLDQVKELFLQEVEKLKKGQFSEDLLHGAINNFKLRQMRQLENNAPRASMFVESFTKDIPWAQQVGEIDRMSRLTKADIVAFANRHFGNNYAVVYKEVGNDSTVKKIDKPVISPILTNRDKASEFLLSVQKSTVKPIEPVFLDFKKDLSVTTTKSKLPVIYKMNNINGTFMLEYLNDRGTTNDKYLGLAFSYLDYIGTPTMSSSQFNKRLYALGCHLSQGAEENKSYVIINGLSENMKAATDLVENLMAHAVVDKEAYEKMVDNYIKGRNDEKLDQRTNFSQLVSYVTYNGQKQRNVLSDSELRSLNPQILVDKIHHFLGYKHRILYYGPQSENTFVKTIETTHHVPTSLKPLPAEVVYKVADTKDNVVYLAPTRLRISI